MRDQVLPILAWSGVFVGLLLIAHAAFNATDAPMSGFTRAAQAWLGVGILLIDDRWQHFLPERWRAVLGGLGLIAFGLVLNSLRNLQRAIYRDRSSDGPGEGG